MRKITLLLIILTNLFAHRFELTVNDILQPTTFLIELKNQNTRMSKFLVSEIDKIDKQTSSNKRKDTKKRIENYDSFAKPDYKLLQDILNQINELLQKNSFYKNEYIAEIQTPRSSVIRELFPKVEMKERIDSTQKNWRTELRKQLGEKIGTEPNPIERIGCLKEDERLWTNGPVWETTTANSRHFLIQENMKNLQNLQVVIYENKLKTLTNEKDKKQTPKRIRLHRLILEEHYPYMIKRSENLETIYAQSMSEEKRKWLSYNFMERAKYASLFDPQLTKLIVLWQDLDAKEKYGVILEKDIKEQREIFTKIWNKVKVFTEMANKTWFVSLNIKGKITTGWIFTATDEHVYNPIFEMHIGEKIPFKLKREVDDTLFLIQGIIELKSPTKVRITNAKLFQGQKKTTIVDSDIIADILSLSDRKIKASGGSEFQTSEDGKFQVQFSCSVSDKEEIENKKAFESLVKNKFLVNKNKKVSGYANSSGENLHWGMSYVSIPSSHKKGEIEAPKWYKFEFQENPREHFSILQLQKISQNKFMNIFSSEAQRKKGEVLLFIHGSMTTFDFAIKRAAQLKYDINFEGACLAYSWPSAGSYFGYLRDAETARASHSTFVEILQKLTAQENISKIHIIAHSMGNRILTSSLVSIQNDTKITSKMGHVIMAAPDVSTLEFKNTFKSTKIGNTAQSFTLYTSISDKALSLSEMINSHERIGKKSRNEIFHQNLDKIPTNFSKAISDEEYRRALFNISNKILEQVSNEYNKEMFPWNKNVSIIDVNDVAKDYVCHSYFSGTPLILQDIHFRIVNNYDPAKRSSILRIHPIAKKIEIAQMILKNRESTKTIAFQHNMYLAKNDMGREEKTKGFQVVKVFYVTNRKVKK